MDFEPVYPPRGLLPEEPPIPVVAPAPVEAIREEIQAADTVAHGRTVYLGDIEMGWVARFAAWFLRMGGK